MLKNKISTVKLVSIVVFCLGTCISSGQSAANGGMNDVIDPGGTGMTLLAVFVVFFTLILLYLVFKILGFILTRKARESVKKVKAASPGLAHERLSGEVNAAIVMALFLYGNEMHDQEDPVITMTKVSRTYSPWSSKIYGLRKSPR